ncbi:MAG: ATP-dependent zinc metalloprotease FtsH [Gammaproteobacteria bacterium]
MSDTVKNLILWLVIAIILVSVFNNFGPRTQPSQKVTYSQFLKEVNQGDVSAVTIENNIVTGQRKGGERFNTYIPIEDPYLLRDLLKNEVNITGKPPEQRGLFMQILISWFPMFLFLAIWLFILRQQMGSGRGGAMSFGRSRARLMGENQIKVTFNDVAGVDEAKHEVQELVEYLRDPGKFQKLGGRIPKGVLLVGPPGTGKTLLAKAVAGEAKVPFFSISGSDFVEMFVGVGASRVRDMFEQAKKQSPCIIFIDELDAVGRHRGAGLGGGHDEREQTLNQLLVEMDGFQGNESVIVVAATNRPDVLDPALLRPGRFDRQVTVGLPDIRGREKILDVHMKKVPLDKDVESSVIARGTPGFAGADLANLVNEAALFAARANRTTVSMHEFEQAKDKIIMGAERHTIMNEDEKRLTAYHESGHAIVGLSVPDHDPVHKVTIIPRGRALGVTMFLPTEDRYSYSRQRLESQLSSLFGGRIAEGLIFGEEKVTTGASNDIQKATEIARGMVTKWGLSALGSVRYTEDDGEVFLGSSMAKQAREISEYTAEQIDKEVKNIIDRNYDRAVNILKENMDKLHAMAEALMKYETIEKQQIEAIMKGEEDIPPPSFWEEKPKSQAKKTQPKTKPKKPPLEDSKPIEE